jgi:hypothetical protein
MKNVFNFKVRISKLSRYHGETSEHHVHGKIHEELYEYLYQDYKEAYESYTENCIGSAQFLSLPLNSFTQKTVLQLIDLTESNPQKAHGSFNMILRELTISNL